MANKRDIRLFYTSAQDDRTNSGFGNAPITHVSGVYLLLQKVAKFLKTSIGSNTYNEELGCDLKNFLLSGVKLEEDSFATYINIALDQVQTYIINKQAGKIIQPEERLVSLELGNIQLNNNGSAEIVVYVTNAKNNTYLVRL